MKNIILLFVLTAMLNTAFAQVSISEDNTPPDSSAMLDMISTDKGLLLPRMTSAQRTLISNPAIGLIVFDTSTKSFWFYNGTLWDNLSESATASIADADSDTKIQVEESADEDVIRFDMAGTEFFRMDSGRLQVLNTGSSVFIGKAAGRSDDLSGNANVFVGYHAGENNTSGEKNNAIGTYALDASTTGSNNNAIGFNSLNQNIDGNNNIAIGKLNLATNISGSGNISIGSFAGYSSIGDNNIFLGNSAGFDETGSDKLYIENSGSPRPLIYGDFTNDSLKIYGTLGIKDNYTFPNTDGAADEVLQTDGDGIASWQRISAAALLGLDSIPPPDFSCLSTVGNAGVGSFPTSVAILGNYAYVVSQTSNDLIVIDVSHPTIPDSIGSVGIGILPTSVAILGNYAYVVDLSSNDLKVIDVSNSANPVISGSLIIGASPTSVSVSGNYAYVVDQSSDDLKVIDVSDPANPTLSGSLAIGALPVEVTVLESYVYVVDESSDDLKVIDISDPANPTLSGSLAIGASAQGLAVLENYVYVIDQSSDDLKVIDVSDPANPTLSGSVSIGSIPSSVAVSGNYAFVVDQFSDDLKVIDVSDPANPVLNDSLNIGSSPQAVVVSGNYAYVVDSDTDDLKVIELSCTPATVLAIDSLSDSVVEIALASDDQTLTFINPTLSIDNGNSVTLGDNMGNHIATTNIQLNGNYLSNDGGNEGIFIVNNGNVGIGTSTPANKVHIGQTGGIQLTNSEIGSVNENPGTILYDANYYAAGEEGAGHFNGDGGGLAVYDAADGWGAIVSTANMQYLEMDVSSLHIGGTSDPGDNNLVVDGVVKIAGGNPGAGKVLTSDADGDASWLDDGAAHVLFAKTSATQSFSNNDTWRSVTPWTSTISNNDSEALFKLEATFTSRLTGGFGNDDFQIRVESEFNGIISSTEVFSFRPDEASGDHDNFKIAPYLIYINPPFIGGNAKFRLKVRNTGDDAWEVEDCVLFVTVY